MDFDLPSELEQIRSEVRKFGENEIEPVANEYDREEKYPHEVMDEAAKMGLLGSQIPIEYGGAGYSTLETIIIAEELFSIDQIGRAHV